MKQLRDSFDSGHVILDLDASDISDAIRLTVERMAAVGIVPDDAVGDIIEALLRREEEAPTAIGNASAVPHAYLDGIAQQVVLFVRLAHPINAGAPDGLPVRFLFFLLGPPGTASRHLDTLASVARLIVDDAFRYEAAEARSARDLLTALDHFLERSARPHVAKPTEPEGLRYTGTFAGGLREDVARRWRHYRSDFLDGLHPKCVASTLFLFFACLAPTITFGGVMAVQTEAHIGAVEMIVAVAIGGVIYSIFSGQPLIILGSTGPILVFTSVLYQFSVDIGVAFLPLYAWVGMWAALFVIIIALADASCLMRYFTRFTDEIFSALISIIFIHEAIKSLVEIFKDLDVKKHHDTALLSLLLALGTYFIAMNLSRFRRSHYLRPAIREFLADFGPAIALGLMTLLAHQLHEVYLDVLPAPSRLATTSGRPWLIDVWALPTWARFAAIGPALLLAVLVFLDQNITARIVNSPDHRLRKGPAYHLDLALVGLLTGFCSLFGLPWLAATVRSLNHVRSLATVEEVVGPHGETREQIIHVRENRITGLAIHGLIGLSIYLLAWLQMVPLAVLYGLFLFMGVVTMAGNQFFERLSLWLRDPALYPVTHYIRRVPRPVIHRFTLLQLVCLVVLYLVKGSRLGILFPIFIALLVPVRFLASRYFASDHLEALDAEEDPEEEQTHWAA